MPSSLTQTSLESLRILVVDDQAINREFLRSGLGPYCARVDGAGSGREAIDRCAQREYDLILMDLHMPEMDGLQTALSLLELELTPAPSHLIFLTADPRAEERLQAAGFNRHLQKPVALGELLRTLQDWLGIEDTDLVATTPLPAGHRLLDLDTALGRCNQRAELLSDLQERFVDELQHGLGSLDDQIRSNAVTAAAARLHQWVGAAGYVGAHSLMTRSQQLRRALLAEAAVPGEADRSTAYVDFLRCAGATIQALQSCRPDSDRWGDESRAARSDQT